MIPELNICSSMAYFMFSFSFNQITRVLIVSLSYELVHVKQVLSYLANELALEDFTTHTIIWYHAWVPEYAHHKLYFMNLCMGSKS